MLRRTSTQSDRTEVRLTKRERSLVRQYTEGWSSKEIGARLGLTTYTVDRYLSVLAAALDLPARRQIFTWAAQNDWRPLVADEWIPPGLHPDGCQCESVWCTAIRVAQSAAALEEYRVQRDAVREKLEALSGVKAADYPVAKPKRLQPGRGLRAVWPEQRP